MNTKKAKGVLDQAVSTPSSPITEEAMERLRKQDLFRMSQRDFFWGNISPARSFGERIRNYEYAQFVVDSLNSRNLLNPEYAQCLKSSFPKADCSQEEIWGWEALIDQLVFSVEQEVFRNCYGSKKCKSNASEENDTEQARLSHISNLFFPSEPKAKRRKNKDSLPAENIPTNLKSKSIIDDLLSWAFLNCVGSIEALVNRINERELQKYRNQKAFARHIKCLRCVHGYTQEEIGRIMGVSSSTIGNWEKGPDGKENTFSIDRQALEAYSLLFYVSPYYLIGLTENIGMYELDFNRFPIKLTPCPIVYRVHKILITFYESSKESYHLNLKILLIYLKICDARLDKLDEFTKFLQSIPAVSKLLKDEFEPTMVEIKARTRNKEEYKMLCKEAEHDRWIAFLYSEKEASSSDCFLPCKARWTKTFDNCNNLLSELGQHNFTLLDLLARIYTADVSLKEAVLNILTYGDFFSNENSFYQTVHATVDSYEFPYVEILPYRFERDKMDCVNESYCFLKTDEVYSFSSSAYLRLLPSSSIGNGKGHDDSQIKDAEK